MKKKPRGVVVDVEREEFCSGAYRIGRAIVCAREWHAAGGVRLKPGEMRRVRVRVTCEKVKS